ncbi:unnamed protein product (macronuclear) [Paramecium tetraurelia]|uniref:Uncharacterized protein n=1 Tax=Paramecium tetraurelia TaxID=5888 RepID=A0CV60_PARTE|nr:uncharacterized protein GSPATT00010845001 [Paramecium tetraurelia]CAK74677.1 unnamed protein product [Paramecium tetraurelia]|eukprot:XP_001442074.1 hypothetical protein (macronuclear) [Paramecium tetraurelia strain d4-2]
MQVQEIIQTIERILNGSISLYLKELLKPVLKTQEQSDLFIFLLVVRILIPNPQIYKLNTQVNRNQSMKLIQILNAFPNATIFRPSVIVGDNDDFAYHWQVQKRHFHNFNIVPDNCQAKKTAYFCSRCILKLQTIEQTYELGGPHVYTLLEYYEMFHNIVQRPLKLAHIDKQLLLKIAQYIPNWKYFNIDYILKHGDDMVVQVGSKIIDDLCVRPLQLTQALQNIFWDIQARYGGSSELYKR